MSLSLAEMAPQEGCDLTQVCTGSLWLDVGQAVGTGAGSGGRLLRWSRQEMRWTGTAGGSGQGKMRSGSE